MVCIVQVRVIVGIYRLLACVCVLVNMCVYVCICAYRIYRSDFYANFSRLGAPAILFHLHNGKEKSKSKTQNQVEPSKRAYHSPGNMRSYYSRLGHLHDSLSLLSVSKNFQVAAEHRLYFHLDLSELKFKSLRLLTTTLAGNRRLALHVTVISYGAFRWSDRIVTPILHQTLTACNRAYIINVNYDGKSSPPMNWPALITRMPQIRSFTLEDVPNGQEISSLKSLTLPAFLRDIIRCHNLQEGFCFNSMHPHTLSESKRVLDLSTPVYCPELKMVMFDDIVWNSHDLRYLVATPPPFGIFISACQEL